jgi:hypothetical protein
MSALWGRSRGNAAKPVPAASEGYSAGQGKVTPFGLIGPGCHGAPDNFCMQKRRVQFLALAEAQHVGQRNSKKAKGALRSAKYLSFLPVNNAFATAEE